MEINKRRIQKMKDLISQNLMESFLPFPLDTKLYSSWASGLPHDGETIIYTSYMYQISGILKRYEELFPKIYRLNLPKRLMTASKFLIKPNRDELDRSFSILKNITSMLTAQGLKFGYLYDEEPYSGALLLESGTCMTYILWFHHHVGVLKPMKSKVLYPVERAGGFPLCKGWRAGHGHCPGNFRREIKNRSFKIQCTL